MEEPHYVKAESVSDFDLALDTILEAFSTEPEDTAPQRAGKTNRKLTAKQQDKIAKNDAPHMTPRVMKNDIRRYFSRMFMNTINSGDFGKLQDYFNTFMKGPTKFVANHEQVDPSLHIPSLLIADGPRLMAHYLLGTFVMYPDMVLLMKNSSITTSSSWTGTKIEMDVEVFSTKMYDLSLEDWVPELSTLGDRYSKLIADKSKHLNAENILPVPNASEQPVQIGGNSPSSLSISSNDTVKSEVSVCSSGATSRKSSSVSLEDSHSNSSCADKAAPVLSEQVEPSGYIAPNKDCQNKRKRGESTITTTKGSTSHNSTSNNSNDNTSTSTSIVTDPSVSSRIPQEFAQSLCANATLLPHPVQLHMVGSITMFLDENNHIQHMNMTLRQS